MKLHYKILTVTNTLFTLHTFHIILISFRSRRNDRHADPHDALLQLRRPPHLRARPQGLLPVRLSQVSDAKDVNDFDEVKNDIRRRKTVRILII